MVKPAIAIGAGAGGLGVGLLILVLVLLFQQRQRLSEKDVDRALNDPSTTPGALSTRQTSAPSTALSGLRNMLGSSNRLSNYNVEPFMMPGEEEPLSRGSVSPIPDSVGRTLSSDTSSFGAQNQIYVLHHDSQSPPVTIYHEDGTRIVELPPRYPASSSGRSEGANEARARGGSRSDSRSDGERAEATVVQRILRQHRRPTVAKKPSEGGLIE